MENDQPLTISVPEAGRQYFGLSRNASYMAAARVNYPLFGWEGYCGCPSALWNACSTRRRRAKSLQRLAAEMDASVE
jgi:hypothetical protein